MDQLPHDEPEASVASAEAIPRQMETPRRVRMRVGLGAGVVLVLVAGALAVLISALSSHPAAAVSASVYTSGSSSTSSSTSTSSTDSDATVSTAASTAFVQVVGAVANPGLYELPAGDRNVDAIAAAGGFTAVADQASVNVAQVVTDGEQLVVAQQGEAPVTAAGSGENSPGSAAASGIVDINTADATTLETLDGIGPALAQRILDYRKTHGRFHSVSDLQNVTGIGPKKFAAIKGSVST